LHLTFIELEPLYFLLLLKKARRFRALAQERNLYQPPFLACLSISSRKSLSRLANSRSRLACACSRWACSCSRWACFSRDLKDLVRARETTWMTGERRGLRDRGYILQGPSTLDNDTIAR